MGSTERPEHGDRPLSDAERIERYEQRVHDHYSRPENRDKLDPFSRMTREEILELYRPEASARPDWHEEPETARRIRADWGDSDAGDREPTGDELLAMENEKASWRERVRTEAFKHADDAIEVSEDRGNELHTALRGPEPTGAETRQPPPIPYVTERRHEDVGAGDVLSGALAASLACYAFSYQIRRYFQELRKGS